MLREETQKEIKCRKEAQNKYSYVGSRFYDGLLNVKDGWGWGCIDENGQQVIPCRYKDQILFSDNGYARVNMGRHQYGLIDRKGFEWIPCQYDNAEEFDDEGYARFEKGIYWGTVGEDGRIRIQPRMKFQQIGPFINGVAMAKIETKWGLIDPDGNHLTEFKYYEISPLADGLYRVRIKTKQYNFLRPDGTHLFPYNFSFINEFDERGYAIFFNEPSKKEKEVNPEAKTLYGIAHISGIIVFPPIYEHIALVENESNDVYFAYIGHQGYYLFQNGSVIDANLLAAERKNAERAAFFTKITKRFVMSKSLVESVLNWTLPGLTLFYRDTQTDIDVESLYKVGDIFRAGEHIEVTPMLYKPTGNVRYIIASSHTAAWYEHPMNVQQVPKIAEWQLHYIHRNSYFKVMDIYKVGEVTQIFLLHIPYRGIGLFLGDTLMNFVADENGTSLIDVARASLDNKVTMDPHPTSLDVDWVKRTKNLVGIDGMNQYYDIEYDTVTFYAPLVDKSIHQMSGDNEEINVPEEKFENGD